jgi:hypothetical protein
LPRGSVVCPPSKNSSLWQVVQTWLETGDVFNLRTRSKETARSD